MDDTTGGAVQWRAFSEYLWAGASEWGPVGTVERGRRYAAIDIRGNVLAHCRTLGEAQQLLEFVAASSRPTWTVR